MNIHGAAVQPVDIIRPCFFWIASAAVSSCYERVLR